jgi:hypothetical protein
MRAARFDLVVLAFVLALASTGCDLEIDAKIVGRKPDAKDVAVIHVTTDKDSELTYDGKTAKVPTSGAIDIEVPANAREVWIHGEHGMKSGRTRVDMVKDMPPELTIEPGYATIGCAPRLCDGKFSIAPVPRVKLSLPAGSIAEIGKDRIEIPASGSIEAPLVSALSPPIEQQPLATICYGNPLGSPPSPVLASLDLSITFPDKVKTTTAKVPLDAQLAMRGFSGVLRSVTKGPVAFPWETAGAPPATKRAAVHVFADRCWYSAAVGAARDAVVADIAVITTAELVPRFDECRYVKMGRDGKPTRETASSPVTLQDKQATAYDRKTGEKLGTKLFEARKECREEFLVRARNPSELDKQSAAASDEPIADWAATFVK